MTARDSCDFWTGGITRCSLAKELLSNFAFSEPDVHFTTGCQSEKAVVLVGPFPHRIPWRFGVDINPTDVRNGTGRPRHEFQALRRLVLEQQIMQKPKEAGSEEK
jgi:hypothetical protein